MDDIASGLFKELERIPASDTPILKRGLRYSHVAMIDMILAEPWISQNELACRFDMSPSWISTVLTSDAFQAALAERREKIVDPNMMATIKEQIDGLLNRSLEVLRDKLNGPSHTIPDQLALRTAELMTKAAGYGAREVTRVEVNVTNQIEDHADRLVTLLRKTRTAVAAEESVDGEVIRPGQSPHRELLSSHSPNGGQTTPPVQSALPGPPPERADGSASSEPAQAVQGT